MEKVALFIAAIATLVLGHFIRMVRWNKFYEVYENISKRLLLNSLSWGYVVNFFVPYYIGDIVRIISVGKKSKNGYSFSAATVSIGRAIDLICVTVMLCLINFFVRDEFVSWDMLINYLLISSVGSFLLIFSILKSNVSKKIVYHIGALFNDSIELSILMFFWGIVSSLKDLMRYISKKAIIFLTVIMWLFYISSYVLFVKVLILLGYDFSLKQFINMLFSATSASSISLKILKVSYYDLAGIAVPFTLYLLIPLFVLFIYSRVFPKNKIKEKGNQIFFNLLPQVENDAKLNFLRLYFAKNQRDFVKEYLEINRNVNVLKDYTAGSNATTILCASGGESFYRKYAFGEDGKKLNIQYQWLVKNKKIIPLPQICNINISENYCYYDMPYSSSAVGMFDFIHSNSTEKSFKVLLQALKSLEENIHTINLRRTNTMEIESYIEEKLINNIRKIENAKCLDSLVYSEYIEINGKKYKNLKLLKKYLNREAVRLLLQSDFCSEVHGDLTIENIICWSDLREPAYYFIDPNTGNPISSPFLDYAKLLQSLHGGYEFLMKTNHVDIGQNKIFFLHVYTEQYKDMFIKYKKYLESRFTKKEVQLIFLHEIIHWLRLMPYKINKIGKKAALFYAGMIIVWNDYVEWFYE